MEDKMKPCDITLIGGGIVGLATALHLSQGPWKNILVLEAESSLARHQTGHNSGVIHSGLYYKPGSAKARYCTEGRRALYRFCETHDIPHEKCGKVVVATEKAQLPVLETLRHRGLANGLTGLDILSPGQLKVHEPYADGIAGLFIGETGIVDFGRVAGKYAELFQQAGGEIRTGIRFIDAVYQGDGLIINTTGGDITTRYLINCGGLQCDRIARACGVEPGIRIVPFRGEYYTLEANSRHLVKHLIYPVPDPSFPFLGVHFTRMIEGGIEAGPNAVLALKREGYRKTDVCLKDAWEIFSYGGFWKLAARHMKAGLGEWYRSLSKAAFTRALGKLIPDIRQADLKSGGAGVRAQALTPEGNLIDDFYIKTTPRMIHVLNAPSPAATASLRIGRAIAEMAHKVFA
jgi:L-2-hydroxyglutarate oxidase